jgi:hypothetical protein
MTWWAWGLSLVFGKVFGDGDGVVRLWIEMRRGWEVRGNVGDYRDEQIVQISNGNSEGMQDLLIEAEIPEQEVKMLQSGKFCSVSGLHTKT